MEYSSNTERLTSCRGIDLFLRDERTKRHVSQSIWRKVTTSLHCKKYPQRELSAVSVSKQPYQDSAINPTPRTTTSDFREATKNLSLLIHRTTQQGATVMQEIRGWAPLLPPQK